MCGIGGIIRFTTRGPGSHRAIEPGEPALRAMTAALRHRGPDGDGVHLEDGVGLAHTRLAIVDRAGGAQPMHLPERGLVVVFNGEIFNHVELRDELGGAGHAVSYTHLTLPTKRIV